ncbi:MAG TPA: hypothetical protein VL974_16410 [Magnetospirillum sp.]|jgi:hypothetical protein|nr:hypothetical protein [Magnetospirillum sp.]
MLKVIVPAGAVLIVAGLAATNPHEDAHARALVQNARKTCGDVAIAKALCGGAVALASVGLRYEDHLFYSTARLGDVHTLGVAGQVMVLSE